MALDSIRYSVLPSTRIRTVDRPHPEPDIGRIVLLYIDDLALAFSDDTGDLDRLIVALTVLRDAAADRITDAELAALQAAEPEAVA
jgi:hypothetical protein